MPTKDNPDKNALFSQRTWDSHSVTKNGGVITGNVKFNNGKASLTGASYITYTKKLYTTNFSLRFKIFFTTTQACIVITNLEGSTTKRIIFDYSGGIFRLANWGTSTPDAVLFTPVLNTSYEVCFTASGNIVACYINGILKYSATLTTRVQGFNPLQIGLSNNNTNTKFTLSLLEIYNKALSSAEVRNLYKKKAYVKPIQLPLLLDFDSTRGIIEDRTGRNTLTATNVEIKKIGKVYGAYFNGSTSKINCGSDLMKTQPIVISIWAKVKNKRSTVQRYLSNNNLIIYTLASSSTIGMTNDNVTTFPTIATIKQNTLFNIIIVVPAIGNINVYLNGGVKTSYNCGPRVNGVQNTTIGNDLPSTTSALLGFIPKLQIFQGVPSNPDEFAAQIYNSEKHLYY